MITQTAIAIYLAALAAATLIDMFILRGRPGYNNPYCTFVTAAIVIVSGASYSIGWRSANQWWRTTGINVVQPEIDVEDFGPDKGKICVRGIGWSIKVTSNGGGYYLEGEHWRMRNTGTNSFTLSRLTEDWK